MDVDHLIGQGWAAIQREAQGFLKQRNPDSFELALRQLYE
jgi:hypothetical protein